jgi:putative heme-binding domain-containing protein
LWWWAVEKHSVAGREEVLRRFVRPTLWKSGLGKDILLPRLVRRYAAERNNDGLTSVVRLLNAAPSDADRHALWASILLGWQEQPRATPGDDWLQQSQQHELAQVLMTAWREAPHDRTLLQLGVALRLAEPLAAARRGAFARESDAAERVALLEMLQPVADPAGKEPALDLLAADQPGAVRSAALRLLGQFDDPQLSRRLIQLHATSKSAALNASIRDVLLARPASAKAWLTAVDRGNVPKSSTSIEEVRRVALFGDPELDDLVAKHWGKLEASTREEKLAEVRRLNNDLRASEGNPAAGKELFKKHCATCHQLFGEGSKVGPDLTSANRDDRDFLLVSLVDPSSVIRKEFVSVIAHTTDGRVLTGLPIARDSVSVTVIDALGQRQTIASAEIDELHDSPVSLMPENLYRQLKPQELRDLFAFLQSKK